MGARPYNSQIVNYGVNMEYAVFVLWYVYMYKSVCISYNHFPSAVPKVVIHHSVEEYYVQKSSVYICGIIL